jgi:flagellar hook-length control protein FliK
MINLTLNNSPPAAQAVPIAAASAAPMDAQGAGANQPFADPTLVAPHFANLLGQMDAAGAVDAADAFADDDAAAASAPTGDDSDSHSDAGQPAALTPAMTMTMAMPMLPAALANAIANASAGGSQADGEASHSTPGQPGSGAATTAAASGASAAQDAAGAATAGAIPPAVAMAMAPLAEPTRAAAPNRPAADAAPGAHASPGATSRAAAAFAIDADGAGDLAAKPDAAGTRDSAVAGAAFGASTPATQRSGGADTVALAGPPTAWRQSLREALGERLQMQAGRGLEQAVIRLDPPNLGRIDIAIRHIAGSLEVTLSATNGEVLRQLHAVSDNLRNDLAQRQYAEVAVTVAPAPRNAAANPFSGDAQGRGRQGEREQDQQAPGLGLFDDGPATSGFSLNGRE